MAAVGLVVIAIVIFQYYKSTLQTTVIPPPVPDTNTISILQKYSSNLLMLPRHM